MDIYITVAKILSLTFVNYVFACECLCYSIAYSMCFYYDWFITLVCLCSNVTNCVVITVYSNITIVVCGS